MSRLYPGFGSGKKPFIATYTVRSVSNQEGTSLGPNRGLLLHRCILYRFLRLRTNMCHPSLPTPFRLSPTTNPLRECPGSAQAHLENGDKVILPEEAFRDVSRLKLPFPLMFKVRNVRQRAKLQTGSKAKGRPGAGKTKAKAPQDAGKKPAGPPSDQYCGLMEFSAPKDVAYIPSWMMRSLRLRDGGRAEFVSGKRRAIRLQASLSPAPRACCVHRFCVTRVRISAKRRGCCATVVVGAVMMDGRTLPPCH